jgi:AcrR family transcriptional regulator
MDNSNVVSLRKASAKSLGKKRELALHAISSLAELGFARMNLRDVAQRSGVSLGVIHYYFESKTELLIYCISIYKEDFISGLNKLIEEAVDLQQLQDRVTNNLAGTIAEHAHIHRLWYDVRAQAMFDAAFQSAVDEVEHGLIGIFQKLFDKLDALSIPCREHDAMKLYIALDGWFRYFLQRQLQGDANAIAAFRQRVHAEFVQLIVSP